MNVFAIRSYPVGRDCFLRLRERELPIANKPLQLRLYNILYPCAAVYAIGLGPKISRIGWMSAELQANEVVFFIF